MKRGHPDREKQHLQPVHPLAALRGRGLFLVQLLAFVSVRLQTIIAMLTDESVPRANSGPFGRLTEQEHDGRILREPHVQNALSHMSGELSSIKTEITENRERIAGLESKSTTPWFKTPSVVVAILAFLLSLTTGILSIQRSYQQDIHQTRSELRGLIQRLLSITREGAVPINSGSALSVIGSNSNEMLLVSQQAAELIDVLSSMPIGGNVTASEYNLVADALLNNGMLESSAKLYEESLRLRRMTLAERVGSMRGHSAAILRGGDIDRGRKEYVDLINFISNNDSAIGYNRYLDVSYTYANWAISESVVNPCGNYMELIDKAMASASMANSGAMKQQVDRELDQMKQQAESFSAACGRTMP